MESVGTRIEKGLSYKNWRQIDLANATGIAKGTINHYIKGLNKPKADKVFIIAKALNVSEAWLMGYDVPIERPSVSEELEKLESKGSYSATVMLKFARLSASNQKVVETLIDSLLDAQ